MAMGVPWEIFTTEVKEKFLHAIIIIQLISRGKERGNDRRFENVVFSPIGEAEIYKFGELQSARSL